MIRKILSAILAISIATSPVTTYAAGETYIYRYKGSVDGGGVIPPEEPGPTNPENPEDQDQYAAGNFIDAYFVSPSGVAFNREVPVATNYVVNWIESTGELPEGIQLDNADGFLRGTSEAVGETEALYYGYDNTGKRIARAKIFFTVFDAEGAGEQMDFYAHTGRYFFKQIPGAEGTDGLKWYPLTNNPPGMQTSRTNAFEGTPAKAGTYAIAWRGVDFMGRNVAYTYGEFLVQDGPVVEFIEDQIADKNTGEVFNRTASVRHKLGDITYRLVPSSINPKGVVIDVERGRIDGVFVDYDMTANYQVEARDSADGRTGLSNVFTLSTTPAEANLASLTDLTAVVGRPFSRQLSAGVKVPSMDWQIIESALPLGISLDRATGRLSGTPSQVEVKEGIVIEVKAPTMVTQASDPFKFTILSEELEYEFTRLETRINRPFETAGITVTSGLTEPMTYTSTPDIEGLTFDPATAKFTSPTGVSEYGFFDQRVDVMNGSNRRSNQYQPIAVYNDPGLAYASQDEQNPNLFSFVRFQNFSIWPQTPEMSVAGKAKFEIVSGTLPAWMTFSETSGSFTGKAENLEDFGTYGPFQVRLTDKFNEPVLSNKFSIVISDREPVTIEVTSNEIQRYVPNDFFPFKVDGAQGGRQISLLQGRDRIPASIRLNAEGRMTGTTTDAVGTRYENIIAKIEDGQGYTAQTEPFDMVVIEPWDIDPLEGGLDKNFRWSAGRSFPDFTIGRLSNAYGLTTYTLNENYFDIELSPEGQLLGRINEVGEHVLTYTADDDTAREPAVGNLAFEIVPPVSFDQAEVYEVTLGQQEIVGPSAKDGIMPYVYTLWNGSVIPQGMSFRDDLGKFEGIPTVEGEYTSMFIVQDKTGMTVSSQPFIVKVNPPKVFSFSYDSDTVYRGSGERYLSPTVVNQAGDTVWSVIGGELPSGLRLIETGEQAGRITGAATQTGIYEGITVFAKDLLTNETHQETIKINVSLAGPAVYTDTNYKVRRGTVPADFTVGYGNVVEPYYFAFADGAETHPDNLTLNTDNSVITAFFDVPGTYRTTLKVVDLFERTKTAKIEFEVIDDLSISFPETMEVQKFVSKTERTETENAMGKVTYRLTDDSPSLPAGLTLDEASGRISGISKGVYSISGYRIMATDAFDNQTATSEPFTINSIDRPTLEFVTPPNLTAQMDRAFRQGITVKGSVGEVSVIHVSGDLPPGITFVDGKFSGTTSIYATYPDILMRVTDTYEGETVTIERLFEIKVVPNGTQITIDVEDGLTRVGYPVSIAAPKVDNFIGDYTWSVTGLEGTGLEMDPLDGAISGTPLYAGMINAALTVTDFAERTRTQTVKIEVIGTLGVAMTQENDLLYNYPYDELAAAQPVGTNIHGDAVWSLVDPDALPKGITLNPSTGEFSGDPEEIGAFGPLQIVLTDSLPGRAVSAEFWYTSLMNEDPILLEVEAYTTKVGYPIQTKLPFYDNTLGAHEFYSLDLAGTNLVVDPQTGVVTGSFATEQDRNINLSITDTTNRVTSKPIELKVLPKMEVVGPTTIYAYAQEEMEPVKVTRSYVVGEATWAEVDQSKLPPGVTFNTETGEFVGSPQKIGTFGPIRVSSTDSLGDTGTSADINFNVTAGSLYLALEGAELPPGMKRIETYEYDLNAHVEAFGINPSALSWNWAATGESQLTPPGLRLVGGTITGVATQPGTYDFTVTVSGGGRTAKQDYRLVINTPEIALDLESHEFQALDWNAPTTFDFTDIVELTNIPQERVKWELVKITNELVPPGMEFKSGVLSGTPTSVGSYTFTVSASFTDGSEHLEDVQQYTIEIVASGQRFTSILAGGYNNACGIDFSGSMKCWGRNVYSELGIPYSSTTSAITQATKNGVNENIVKYTLGSSFTCYLNEAGEVKCFGMNTGGQLGRGSTNTAFTNYTPIAANLSGQAIDVSAGSAGACAVLSNGTVECWGNGSNYALGNNSTGSAYSPVQTAAIPEKIKAVDVGRSGACAISQSGSVYCWGLNTSYQFGNATATTLRVPTLIPQLGTDNAEIQLGFTGGCSKKDSGQLYCWGYNSKGTVGNGTNATQTTPLAVPGFANIKAFSTSSVSDVVCAIKSDGTAWCWGSNATNQLGTNDSATNLLSPTQIPGVQGASDISYGQESGCLVGEGNKGQCFGLNGNGARGNGTLTNPRPAPAGAYDVL